MIKLIQKALILVSGTGAAQIISFLSLPIISRLYRIGDVGDFAVFSSLCWITAVLATFQLEHAIILPKSNKQALYLTRLVFIFGALVSLAAGLILYICLSIFDYKVLGSHHPLALSLLMILTVFGISTTQALRAYLIRLGDFKNVATGSVLMAASTSVTVVFVALVWGDRLLQYGLLIGQTVGLSVATIFWLIKSNWTFGIYAPVKILALYKKYKAFGFTLTFSNATKTGYGRLPTLIVTAVGGGSAAGYFGLAERVISAPTALIAQALAGAFRHYLGHSAASKDYYNVLKVYWKTITIAALSSFPFFVVGILIAPWVFELVFGLEWRKAGEYASILLVGEAFIFALATVEDTTILLRKNSYRLFWHSAQFVLIIIILLLGIMHFINDVSLALYLIVGVRVLFVICDLLYFYCLTKVYKL